MLERAVELEAHYLASGLRSIVYATAPERIILGGGVSGLSGLLDSVREKLGEHMNGYARFAEHERDFVVRPGLGSLSGIAGGLAIAHQTLASR